MMISETRKEHSPLEDLRPIGVFDSGCGGLAVLQELIGRVPRESIIYVADTARFPYGSRSEEEICKASRDIAHWLVNNHDVKLLVIACNTVSAVAVDFLRKEFSIPVIGVFESGLREIARTTRSRKVGLLATTATIKSGAYQKAASAFAQPLSIICQACPQFVQFVERGDLRSSELQSVARTLLEPICRCGVDTILLACTHYSFLVLSIQAIVGRKITVVTSDSDVANLVARQIRSPADSRLTASADRSVAFYCTGDTDSFRLVGSSLLGSDLTKVTKIIV